MCDLSSLVATVMSIAVLISIIIGIFLLIRKRVLWYLKIEEVTKKQEEIYAELNQIKRLLKENTDKRN